MALITQRDRETNHQNVYNRDKSTSYLLSKQTLLSEAPLGKDTVSSERIGWQTDPTWEDGGRRGRACPCPRPNGIELFPVNGKAFDPPLQQFLILAVLEPFVDGCL